MDSGNSGSLPSSSGGDGGGDDVYDDSRRNDQTLFAMQQPNLPPSSFFDTTSFSQQNHLINPNPNITNPMYNLDSLWTRNPNQNPNPNPVFNAQNPVFNQNPVEPDGGPAKVNPKKRTRASRRAPTTVLTTDTTNFRQMVQEFTGIPNAPFAATSSSSSPFTRQHHLNLYNNSTSTVQRPSYMNMNATNTSIFSLPPSDIPSFTKQPLNLSHLQNQLFPFQTVQVGENRYLEGSTSTSVKKFWRGESENMGNVQNGVFWVEMRVMSNYQVMRIHGIFVLLIN
ncbi:VQ motif-containing protein [Tanacetum coccineum]